MSIGRSRLSVILACGLVLGACAPTLIAEASGDRQALRDNGAFRFADGPIDPQVRKALILELQQIGLQERADAPLLLTVTNSDRPRTVGILPSACDPVPSPVRAPQGKRALRSDRVVSLAVIVSEVATGRVRFQAAASKRATKSTLSELAPALARAAFTAPATMPAEVASECPR